MNKSRFLGNSLVLLALCVAPIGCGADASNDESTGGTGGVGATGGTGGSGATGGAAGSGGIAGSGGVAGSSGAAGAAGSGGGGGVADIDCASGDILAYDFGNQITGSELHVQADGTVVHNERTCCPPTTTDKNAPALEATKLTELKGWIEAAKTGTISVEDGQPTSLGSSAGTLAVCSSDGTAIVIHNILRNDTLGQPDRIESNTAAKADEIRAYVKDVVSDDMPWRGSSFDQGRVEASRA